MRSEPAYVTRSFQDFATKFAAFAWYLAAVALAISNEPQSPALILSFVFLLAPLFTFLDCWLEHGLSISGTRIRAIVAYIVSCIFILVIGYLCGSILPHSLFGYVPTITAFNWLLISAIASLPMWGVALFFAECDLKLWQKTQPPPDMTEARAMLEAQSSIPVDLNKLAHNLGLWVSEPYFPDAIAGEIVRSRRGVFVLRVNGWHSPYQGRLTLAHQIGHFVLHRHLLGEITTDNKTYNAIKNSKITAAHEAEANEFAEHLLMPDKFVDRFRTEGLDLYLMAHQFDVTSDMMRARLATTEHALTANQSTGHVKAAAKK